MTPGSSPALLFSLIAVTLLTRCGCTDIIGGQEVCPHSWPYMAAIQVKNLGVLCGGTLVEKQWVLTAAHCRIDKSKDRVVLGAHRASVAEKEQQIFKIVEAIPHCQFDWHSRENDIMLLKAISQPLLEDESFERRICQAKLNDTAKLNKYVQLLPLPDSFEDVAPDTLCKVAGWGRTSSGKPSPYLQEATLKIVDRKSCREEYAECPRITKNMLCAIGNGSSFPSDACLGDSGGPLICAGQYHGIVSFGEECGKTGRYKPGVYTRLAGKYIDWIKRTISSDRDP